MRISEVAAESGVDPATLRLYESAGVLPQPPREASGYRSYDSDDVALIRFVRRLRSLQLPLDDVKQIVELRLRGEAPCRVVRGAMEREAGAIEERISELISVKQELESLIAAAGSVVDEWPKSCVCHVIESEES